MKTLSVVGRQASTCTRCALAETRTQVVFGAGDAKADLLLVGEAPGRDEDLKGEPFIGRSGQLLTRLIEEELGLTRDDIYIANVVKCRPPNNRDPKPVEIEACSGWLDQQLQLIDPKVVLTVGNFATRTLLGTTEGITKLRGSVYPFGSRWLVPTFHPAAALRSGGETVAKMRSDLVRAKRILQGDLTEAVPA